MKALIIEKEKLKHNIQAIKEHAKTSGRDDDGNYIKIIAVVKSNGYGLDIVKYTQFLIDNGIEFFAVATIEEALKLRQAGIKKEILMLSSTAIEDDVRQLVENNITITIGSKESAKVADKVGQDLKKTVKAHIKIDTGFGRYGFLYTDKDEIITTIKALKNVETEGTYTHFSLAFYEKDEYTHIQFRRFIDVIEAMKNEKLNTGFLHVCNSSAFIKFPKMHLNAVRVGSAFTGRMPFTNDLGLQKVGYLESQVAEIKELPKDFNIGYSNAYTTTKNTKIAVIPVGYADGYNMVVDKDMFRNVDKLRYIVRDVKDAFKKQFLYVNIKNENCEVLGRVGTFHIIADISGKDIKIGDKVKINVNPQYIDSGVRREYK